RRLAGFRDQDDRRCRPGGSKEIRRGRAAAGAGHRGNERTRGPHAQCPNPAQRSPCPAGGALRCLGPARTGGPVAREARARKRSFTTSQEQQLTLSAESLLSDNRTVYWVISSRISHCLPRANRSNGGRKSRYEIGHDTVKAQRSRHF